MEYTVEKGDTIAKVTKLLGTDWQTLKKMNGTSVGRSKKNNNWFLREGATVSVDKPFEKVLEAETKMKQTAAIDLQSLLKPGEKVHTVKKGDTVWHLAVNRYHVDPVEMLRLNNILDPTKLQPGRKLRIPQAAKKESKEVIASWYGKDFHGRPMANGQRYNMYGNTIAHRDMPLGTKVELTNPTTGKRVRAVVADRGPYVEGREVDLSYNLARQLALVDKGVGRLVMRVL